MLYEKGMFWVVGGTSAATVRPWSLAEGWRMLSSLRKLTAYNTARVCPPHAAAIERRPCSNRSTAGLLLWARAGTDGQTDTVSLHRPGGSAYCADSANNRCKLTCTFKIAVVARLRYWYVWSLTCQVTGVLWRLHCSSAMSPRRV